MKNLDIGAAQPAGVTIGVDVLAQFFALLTDLFHHIRGHSTKLAAQESADSSGRGVLHHLHEDSQFHSVWMRQDFHGGFRKFLRHPFPNDGLFVYRVFVLDFNMGVG